MMSLPFVEKGSRVEFARFACCDEMAFVELPKSSPGIRYRNSMMEIIRFEEVVGS